MDILALAIGVAFVLVMLGIVFAFVRLILGPTLPDRIVALDMMVVLIVSFCGVYALLSEDAAFIDVAIVLALVGFLATVALARYVERAHRQSASTRKPDTPPAQEDSNV